MLSDDVLQVADDPLSPKQPLIEMIIVAVPELPEAGEQACRRSGCDGFPPPPALAIPRQRPLDVQQIPLAGDGVPSPVPVAYGVRQPPFRPCKAAPGRGKGRLWLSLRHREHLPIPLKPQVVGVKPAFDQQTELFQLAPVRPESGQVVHIPGVMLAQPALPDGAAAVKIHPLHHPGLQDLDEGVVDILVGPLGRFADGAPLPGVRVPPLADMRLFRLKAADEYSPQVFHPLRLGLFHPRRTGVGLVASIPVVGAVHFVDGA